MAQDPNIDLVSCYIPPLVVEQVAADPTPVANARSDRFHAAVMLADITGFTPLAEKLARKGAIGAEELSSVLNAYFTQLVGLITEHGGSVVKFAGDALTALWPARGEGLAQATLRAAQCALLIQQRLNAFAAAPDTTLSLCVSVSAGPVAAMTVGGVLDRWEFLVAGKPVIETRKDIDFSSPGHAVISRHAWGMIQESCVAGPAGEDCLSIVGIKNGVSPRPWRAPELKAEAAMALWAYLPGAIRHRIAAGQTEWLAELRRVTVMFVNVPELDEGSPAALAQAQTVMVPLQNALYRYEGSVDKLSMDFAGLTMIAALGLPPLSHEDDAVRAVLAAVEMRAKLKELGLGSNIGITTGRAFCGAVGSAARREYTMIGDTVNLAARLMQASDGLILCDGETYQSCQARIEFAPLERIRVKGKADPIAVYSPRGEKRSSRKAGTLVGRIEERKMIAGQLEGLRAGGGGGVLIFEGEAGIGKSVLVANAVLQASSHGLPVFAGAADAVEIATSYHAFKAVIGAALDLPPGSDRETQRQLVHEALSGNARFLELAPLLNDVLGLEFPENELTSRMPAEGRADATRELLIHLFERAASRGPIVVLIEDAQWLDSSSRKLLVHLRQRVQPLLLVIAARPQDHPSEEWEALVAAAGRFLLRLKPLPQGAAVELVCQQLGVAQLAQPIIEFLTERAEGHPFFSEELAYALRDAGLIVVEGRKCRVAPNAGNLKELKFPETLQGVITARIDNLAPPEQLAIKVASVVGRIFLVPHVLEIYPVDQDRPIVPACVRKLARLDLTPPHAQERDLSYMFKHIITQEVAYGLMVFSQRRTLHRKYAEALEARAGADLPALCPLLAHHWREAGSADKAIHYFERAGVLASGRFANREAIHFFESAIALDRAADAKVEALRRARWHRRLAEAQLHLGLTEECSANNAEAFRLMGKPVPGRRAVGLLLLREALRQCWRRCRGQEPAAASPANQADLVELTLLGKELSRMAYHQDNVPLMVYGSLFGLNTAERAGHSSSLAELYVAVGCVAAAIPGLGRVAERYCGRALAAASQDSDPSSRAWVEEIVGVCHMGWGNWDQLERLVAPARQVQERFGHRRLVEECLLTHAYMKFFTGDFNASRSLFDEMRASAQRRGDRQSEGWANLGLARNSLALGEHETALQILAAADSFERDKLSRAEFLGIAALAHTRSGDLPKGAELAAEALKLIGAGPPATPTTLPAAGFVAEVFLRPELDGRAALKRVVRSLRAYARVFPVARPRLALVRGGVALREGRPRHAARLFKAALDEARSRRMLFEEGLAHLHLARSGAGAGHAGAAAGIFARCGAAHELALARGADRQFYEENKGRGIGRGRGGDDRSVVVE